MAANADERETADPITHELCGKLIGDRSYISQNLFNKLMSRGLKLITELRRNMKNRFISTQDKLLLRKRAIIETINDQLKNISNIEHTRHRSLWNFLGNATDSLLLEGKETALEFEFQRPCSKLYRLMLIPS
jgi:predicted ATPase